jgi:hypothetical protein
VESHVIRCDLAVLTELHQWVLLLCILSGYVYDISTGLLNTLPQARVMARETAWSTGAIVSTVAMQVIPK